MSPDKSVERLEKILGAFMDNGVSPEELIQAIDTVMAVIKQSEELLKKQIDESDATKTKELKSLESANGQIATLIERAKKDAKTDIAGLKKQLAKEIARVESKIPEIPEAELYDDNELRSSLAEHKAILNNLNSLILGENIRNALEVLPDGEKLAISAIEGLEEELKKREEQRERTTALIAHRLDQIGDVSISGVTDGQVLTYNSTTGLWEAQTPTGTGGGHTIEDEGTPLTQRDTLNFVGSGVTVTDAGGKTVVTIPGGGGGGGAVDSVNGQTGVVVLDADDIDDTSTAHKFATAAEKTKLSNISISQPVDLDALETASHAAVTVTDSAEIDFTLTGQDITASLKAGSIDESKLDASVNASLDLADSASQPGHTHTLANVTDVTMTVANLNSLDDGVDSTLHFHATDRARANHTGTQLASTISDFNEAAQDTIGGALLDSTSIDLIYDDAGNTISAQREALTGAITASKNSNTTSLGSFTVAQLNTAISDADVATGGGTATGTNTGDQTITLTSDVTGSGTGSFATTIANNAVSLAKMADVATSTVFYRKTAGTGDPEVQTLATLKTDLGLTGTNSGDQTSIVGITGTKAQFNTAVTDGDILYVGDVTQYTDELAQDAVGAMAANSTFINLTYSDATPSLTPALSATGTPSSSTYLRGDNTWAAVAGGTNTYFNDVYYAQANVSGTTWPALTGSVNGSNTAFTVPEGVYVAGTLEVYLRGVLQARGEYITETTPASGIFNFVTAPLTDDDLVVKYQKQTVSASSIDEIAQDAVGAMVDSTLVYTDGTPLLSRAALAGAITASAGSNATSLGSFTTAQLNTALSDGDVATGGGTATGTNTGDQNLFSTIAVSGQSNVVADSTTDTLTLVAGTNVTITTNATTDEITINATGGGGGGGPTLGLVLAQVNGVVLI